MNGTAKNVKEVVVTKILLPGTRVQLWPKDTFFKYGVVTAVDTHYVTFKITLVHPGEKHYREGDIVKIHKSMLYVHVF